MLDEQVAMLKEITDLLLDSLLTANQVLRGFRRSSTSQFRHRGRQRFAYLGQCLQNSFRELRNGMKLAYLVREFAKDFSDWRPGLIGGTSLENDIPSRLTTVLQRAAISSSVGSSKSSVNTT